MYKTEFKVISANGELAGMHMTTLVNAELRAGWSLQGPMISDGWGLRQPMTREIPVTLTVNAVDAKTLAARTGEIAKAMAKAINGAAIDMRVRHLVAALRGGAHDMRIIAVVNEPRTTTPGFTREIAPGHSICGYAANIIVLGSAADYTCDVAAFNQWVNDVLRCRLNPNGYIVRIDQ